MGKEKQNIKLTCEYLNKPIGIQNQNPRFGWQVLGESIQTGQKAYRIRVFDDIEHCVWDSGKTESARCSAVEYDGLPLQSFGQYRWELTLWQGKDQETTTEEIIRATDIFEMGILEQKEWRGQWLSAKEVPADSVPLFRREFNLVELPKQARIYLSGIGYCEAWLNDKKLGDAILDPGWTNYNKTVLYRVYDISGLLRKGKNVFSAELGGGWLALDHIAFHNMIGKKTSWLAAPKILCNIYLDDQCIATVDDGSWLYAEGPIRSHNLYDGEYYDAALERPGYRLPEYREDMVEWRTAEATDAPLGKLRSQIMPPIRITDLHNPHYIAYVDDDNTIVADFGMNFSGWVRLKAKGKCGQKIQIRYAEVLDKDGRVDQRNLRTAKGEDVFIFGEQSIIIYQPHFVYHGFRYVQIAFEAGIIIEEITGCEVHTDIKTIGSFTCSNTMLNQIQTLIQRTEKNNLHSVPTDCPQRDERLGWLNDMTVRFEEGLYNFDLILFYEKWLQDIADEQREDGAIPDTVPYFFGDLPATHISSIYLLLPWYLYLFYDDRQILRRHYVGMKKYLNFKLRERNADGLLPKQYIGEWAPPMTEALLGWGENAVPKNLTQSFITTGYLYYDCCIMEKVSLILKQEADARQFCAYAKEVAQALNDQFFQQTDGFYDTGAQGCNIFALFLHIVPEAERKHVLKYLLEDLIEKRQYHITTGNQMTKYLYEVLNQEKQDDKAFQIATCETYPSIGYMLKKGATTFWERWEYLTGKHMNSHNHPMLGAFTTWFFKGLAGLRLDETENRCLHLRPAIINALQFVEAEHAFPWGKCRVRWEKTEHEIIYSFDVPWNMKAVVDLSNCLIPYQTVFYRETEIAHEELSSYTFTSGSYQLRIQLTNTN